MSRRYSRNGPIPDDHRPRIRHPNDLCHLKSEIYPVESTIYGVFCRTLANETARLMTTYIQFKGGPPLQPFTEDRRVVFRAGVRALFTDIIRDHQSTGRLVDFVDAITGVWGLHPQDSNGRHQFRLSIRWKPELHAVISPSDNFNDGGDVIGIFKQIGKWLFERPHVLMPGDDHDPNFDAFDVQTNGVLSYRQQALPQNLWAELGFS